MYCRGESTLNASIFLAAHAGSWLGILLTRQRSTNAGIESTGPVSRDANHPPQGPDGQSGYLRHSDLSHASTSFLDYLDGSEKERANFTLAPDSLTLCPY